MAHESGNAGDRHGGGRSHLASLTPGSNTFTLQALVTDELDVAVIPPPLPDRRTPVMMERRSFDDLPGAVKDAVYEFARPFPNDFVLSTLVDLYEQGIPDCGLDPQGELVTRSGPTMVWLQAAGLVDLLNLTGAGTQNPHFDEEEE